ncbi:MAG: hypothetical protein PUD03_01015 [Lachnospiraceae bacterium]|nr:hypothetical protein [Lachnospiraceae bacterium]
MDLTGFISAGVLACVFFGAMHWVTKDFMGWRKGIDVVFSFLFVLQESVSLYGIYHDRMLQAVWFVSSMLMILILIIGQRHDRLRIAMNYLTSLFFFRIYFLFAKLVFISFYSGFHTEKLRQLLGTDNIWIFLYSLVICLPGAFALDFTQKSMQYLSGGIRRAISVFAWILWLVMDWFDEWIQMVVIVPIGLLLILTLIIYRISKEKEQEKELYYHRELEAQLRKKDLEMKKLRKEVEKYYILAGVDEKDYPEQVLRHIDNAYTDEKSAVDTDTATEE